MIIAEAESLLAQRSLCEALAAFDRAEREGEDSARCSAGRWQAHMLLGDFESAWQESDAIRARNTPDPHRFWNGEDLTGKRVILRCLHGLGDAVQFLRYLPMLQSLAAHVTVQVPPALLQLTSHFRGVTDVATWSCAENTEPAWDVQIEASELPYIFRTQLADLPIAEKYVSIPPTVLGSNRPHPRHSSSLRVGVVWSCGAWNPARNIPFGFLRTILEEPGCEFWNLQGGGARTECIHPSVHRAESCADSLTNLAAIIAQLDLVLSTDTLAAHLAGALGTPAFVMLPYAADWRWMHNRADSPWYPNLCLFRQHRPNDWSSVIENVRAALSRWVAASLVA